ncbi:MAG: hypothetical protein COA73_01990 [Candidatus Hydrogenedentota bacterium]|nr:MAG: hypothetical protein COA73_01990 [Candidatus Hydrogenedentota bacterium]
MKAHALVTHSIRRTQEERWSESNRRMLDAAIRLIANQGIAKTTLALVGEEAGYSRGLASHRFGTKSELLVAVVKDIQDRFATTYLLPGVENYQGVEAVLKAIDIYFDTFSKDVITTRAFYVLLTSSLTETEESAMLSVKANERFREFFEGLIGNIDLERDGVSDVDPSAQARLIVGMLRGVTLEWLIDPDPVDLQQVGKNARQVLQTALSW